MDKSESLMLRLTSSVALGLTYPFSTSYNDAGEYMLHGLLNSSSAGGFFRAGSRGEDIGMKRWFGSEEARKKLWQHTVEATSVQA